MKDAFNIKEKEISDLDSRFAVCNKKYYEENVSDKTISHIIFAKEGTDAGEFYNITGLQSLRFLLNYTIGIKTPQQINFLDSFKNYIKENYSRYYAKVITTRL